ncbi:hypothetical protein JCM19233_675 [Vibrio astriarenae]|nr:hypothetical protein JCM19233_675 [Vibrio sp. C7]
MNQIKPKIEPAPAEMQVGALFKTKNHGYAEVVQYYNTHTVIISFKIQGIFEQPQPRNSDLETHLIVLYQYQTWLEAQ